MATTKAQAHPNIALVKYWGKRADNPANYPATPNISITLSELVTTTTVSDLEGADADTIRLNGEVVQDAKIANFMATMRKKFDLPPLAIDTSNNFPTGAGLASSASGFAALVCALDAHAQLGLSAEMRSDWARRGSASAARSMFSGYVALIPPQWRALPIASAEHWPLATVVATTSQARKSVSSTEGMEASRLTSPFYDQWVDTSSDDYATAAAAIELRDFAALADIAEHNCLKMHAVMQTTRPPLIYWRPATLACMATVRELRSNGTPVFFTIDAGPQVKAICLPAAATEVAAALSAIDGVDSTTVCGMGEGARALAD